MELLSRIVFACASFVLMILAAGLLLFAVGRVTASAYAFDVGIDKRLLGAIGYVVVAIAVFDVAKYLAQEEVVRGREMRRASEARRSLTKFISTIVIAVLLEALVLIFEVSREELTKIIYPTALMLAAIALIVGLGVFQRLSVEVERRTEPDRAPEKGTE